MGLAWCPEPSQIAGASTDLANIKRPVTQCSGGLLDGIQAGGLREYCRRLDIIQEGRELLDGRIRVKWDEYRTEP